MIAGVEKQDSQCKSLADLKFWMYGLVQQMALTFGASLASLKHINEIVGHLVAGMVTINFKRELPSFQENWITRLVQFLCS